MTSPIGTNASLVRAGWIVSVLAATILHGCSSSTSSSIADYIAVCRQNCDVEGACRADAGQGTFDVVHCKDSCTASSTAGCPNVAGVVSHAKRCLMLECTAYLACIDEGVPCDLIDAAADR
jgi:hypothetical protein